MNVESNHVWEHYFRVSSSRSLACGSPCLSLTAVNQSPGALHPTLEPASLHPPITHLCHPQSYVSQPSPVLEQRKKNLIRPYTDSTPFPTHKFRPVLRIPIVSVDLAQVDRLRVLALLLATVYSLG